MEIEIIENVMQYNKEEADSNRDLFKKNNVFVINFLSAPGAGKTSLITETIKLLGNSYKIGVIEGDISSTYDAQKIKHYIDDVIQINTGGTCHLNASMIALALSRLNLKGLDILIIENVGNLICPVGFDLGENSKVVISSVTEGDDKPVKYPKVFIKAGLVVLNKIDMMEYNDFEYDFFESKIKELNPGCPIVKVSCKTGSGLDEWADWLRRSLKLKKK